jgi:phosphate uptake regulator
MKIVIYIIKVLPNVKLELESSDKKEFSVPVEVAQMSLTIKNMLEDLGDA